MADTQLIEDDRTGVITLSDPLILGLGISVATVALAIIVLVGVASNLNSEAACLYIFPGIFLVFLLPLSLSWRSITIDPRSRTLIQQRRPLLLPLPPTSLQFSQIENIEVSNYHTKYGYKWMVSAKDHAGYTVGLNSGERDEMVELAHKIASMTGAPLLDHSEPGPTLVDKILSRVTGDWTTRSQSEEASPLDEYLQRASPVPPTESLESAPDSDPSAATTQVETSVASSAPDDQGQRLTPVETPAPVAATAETEPAPAHRDVRDLPEEDLEKLVAADGTDPGVLYALAGKYRASGLLDRALELYRRTVDLDPSNVQAQNDLGAAFAAGGRRPEAEAAFRHAIALDPYSYNAHLLLARLLSAMNRKEEASQEYLRARENARDDDERQAAAAESNA